MSFSNPDFIYILSVMVSFYLKLVLAFRIYKTVNYSQLCVDWLVEFIQM